MAHLKVFLFGSFQVWLNGEKIGHFRMQSVRALLAYLACNKERAFERQHLQTLLWPDKDPETGGTNLRGALFMLRKLLPNTQEGQEKDHPFFHATRREVYCHPASDCWVDALTFEQRLADASRPQPLDTELSNLEAALALYKGPFLDNFEVDSDAYEDWLCQERQRLHQQAMGALNRLAALYEKRGDFEAALRCARRRLELEPENEDAHRQVMHFLAHGGQRGAALAHYENLRHMLSEESGAFPTIETLNLFRRIRDGELGWDTSQPLGTALETPRGQSFVGRQKEMVHLVDHLDIALAGQGHTMFVTGDTGSGKTALLEAFVNKAIDIHEDVIIAWGNCTALAGTGGPYLPFIQMLQFLSGDIAARHEMGNMRPEQVQRLLRAAPLVMQALAEEGGNLVGAFLPARSLLQRAAAFSPALTWMSDLKRLAQRAETTSPANPSQIYNQFGRVLQRLARRYPLVLIVDDLQWADQGTLELLYHFGRSLIGLRLLVVGAYRRSEVRNPPPGSQHSLLQVTGEFERRYGNIIIDMDQADGWQFINAYLDNQPNHLDDDFRQTLHRYTAGHALFTAELLEELRAHGQLIQDAQGAWVAASRPDWDFLPGRVEAVIAARIARLSPEQRRLLAVASVEGEEFSAEIIAPLAGLKIQATLDRLSGDLRREGLVQAVSMLRLPRRRLSRYRFRNILFQKYLYDSLDRVQRADLHEKIGHILEAACKEDEGELENQAALLAWHFENAGLPEKAADYLLKAGLRAVQVAAYLQAVDCFQRGLGLLEKLPEPTGEAQRIQRARQEYNLQTALWRALFYVQGWGAAERARAGQRAYELSQRIGATEQMLGAFLMLVDAYNAHGRLPAGQELGEQLLRLANEAGSQLYNLLAHLLLGVNAYLRTDLSAANEHFLLVTSAKDTRDLEIDRLADSVLVDSIVYCLSYNSDVWWLMGYPQPASQRSQTALARARRLGNPITLAFALSSAGGVQHLMRHEFQAAMGWVEELVKLVEQPSVATFRPLSQVMQGRLLVQRGKTDEGLERMKDGHAAWKEVQSQIAQGFIFQQFVEAYTLAEQVDQSMSTIEEALTWMAASGINLYEAEMWRQRGLLMLSASANQAEQAEYCYHKAMEISRRQRLKMWELRAAANLSQLWQTQGRGKEAYELLHGLVFSFHNSFDTPDLMAAQRVLAVLEYE